MTWSSRNYYAPWNRRPWNSACAPSKTSSRSVSACTITGVRSSNACSTKSAGPGGRGVSSLYGQAADNAQRHGPGTNPGPCPERPLALERRRYNDRGSQTNRALPGRTRGRRDRQNERTQRRDDRLERRANDPTPAGSSGQQVRALERLPVPPCTAERASSARTASRSGRRPTQRRGLRPTPPPRRLYRIGGQRFDAETGVGRRAISRRSAPKAQMVDSRPGARTRRHSADNPLLDQTRMDSFSPHALGKIFDGLG